MAQRVHLLLWCAAAGLIAFACLNYWSEHNAPLYKRFDLQWREDVEKLEASHKLPPPWFDVRELAVEGGTPETKSWLKFVHVPIKTKPDGHFHLDVLVVAWEEEGKRGVMVQYNLVDLRNKNTIWELGRTLILSQPKDKSTLKAALEELQ